MAPSKEDILLAFYGRKQSQEDLLKEKSTKQAYLATIENYSYKAGKWIVAIVILSVIMAIFVGIGSLILTFFALILILAYYYGIKRFMQNKLINKTKYYCIHCNHVFVGPREYCEECGVELNCNRNMYRCSRCGQYFISKKKTCPHCKVTLYY